LLDEIARGGMGVVFKARQESLNRVVALKMVLAGPLASPDDVQRLRREAEAAAQLDHPNIVPIYEVGEHDGLPYFSMKLVEGGSLDQHAARFRHDGRAAARLLAQVARAVHYAHQRGLLHRDLKPANVLLDGQDQPHITDFGLAKRVQGDSRLTRSGAVVGTPSYMAPEQAAGQQGISTAADVYALGAILYELLTGRAPFRADNPLETLFDVVHRPPPPPRALDPGVDPDLETICLKCLEKEPGRRYASALALADDLERWLHGEPIQARRNPRWLRLAKWARRKPALAALALVSLLAALVVAGGGAWFTWRLKQEHGLKEEQRQYADEEREQAERQRQRAEANLRQALRAVNQFYTQVSEGRLLGQPGMKPARHELLQAALEFYRQLVQEQSDDPEVRLELGKACLRLAQITIEVSPGQEAVDIARQGTQTLEELATAFPQSAEYRGAWVRGLIELGNYHVQRKQLAPAGKAFGVAVREAEQLAGADPENLDHRRNWAVGLAYRGLVYAAVRKWAEAEADLLQALRLAEHLSRADPQSPKNQDVLGLSHSGLGNLHLALGRTAAAQEHLEKALALREHLARHVRTNPSYGIRLAGTQRELSQVYRRTGQGARAQEVIDEAVAFWDRTCNDHPEVIAYQLYLAGCYLEQGKQHRAAGRGELAVAAYRRVIALGEQLVRADPDRPLHPEILAEGHQELGTALSALGRTAEAEEAFQKALDIVRPLVRDQPDIPELALVLAGTACQRGHLLKNTGRAEAALAWYTEAIAALEGLLRNDGQPAQAREFLRNSFKGRGNAQFLVERYAEALADLDRALELDDGSGRLSLRLDRGRTLARGGDHRAAGAEAESIARLGAAKGNTAYTLARIHALAAAAARRDDRLTAPEQDKQAERYAQAALAWLRGVSAAGWFRRAGNLQALREDKDLDALRARDDFQRLLREAEQDASRRSS
jgi:tetratricopeptide (TPR) repeat protein